MPAGRIVSRAVAAPVPGSSPETLGHYPSSVGHLALCQRNRSGVPWHTLPRPADNAHYVKFGFPIGVRVPSPRAPAKRARCHETGDRCWRLTRLAVVVLIFGRGGVGSLARFAASRPGYKRKATSPLRRRSSTPPGPSPLAWWCGSSGDGQRTATSQLALGTTLRCCLAKTLGPAMSGLRSVGEPLSGRRA